MYAYVDYIQIQPIGFRRVCTVNQTLPDIINYVDATIHCKLHSINPPKPDNNLQCVYNFHRPETNRPLVSLADNIASTTDTSSATPRLLLFSRLLEIKYKDNGRYPLDVLAAILTPRLIKKRYTFPAENKKSRKPPLPDPIFKAIMKVAAIRLKNTNMTLAEFKYKLRQKFSSIKYKRKVRTFHRASNQLLYYPYDAPPFQKNQPKQADTETSDGSLHSDDGDNANDTRLLEPDHDDLLKPTSSGSSKKTDSGATQRTRTSSASNPSPADDHVEHEDQEYDTQLIDNAGASGMNFVVMQAATPSSSLMLPAPAEAVSNPLFSGKNNTYADVIEPFDGKKKEDSPHDDDYILSSSQSSEEDD